MNQDKCINLAIADDHIMVRKGIISLLSENEKFRVVAEGSNGRELIDAISKLPEPPDVCLLDINMPVMDGHKALIHLKKEYPLMKFLALSVNDHEFHILKMLRSGANGYLLKESDPRELRRAVEYLYSNEFYHSDLVNHHLITIIRKGEESDIDFSDVELEVLKYCCTEMGYREIADLMHKSVRTIEGYRNALFEKIGTNSRIGLMIFALKTGIGQLGANDLEGT